MRSALFAPIFFALALLVGCNNAQTDATLDQVADSVLHNPEWCAAQLEPLAQPTELPRAQRLKLATLSALTRHENHQPVEHLDELRTAANYYRTFGAPRYRAMSLTALGFAYRTANNPVAALDCFRQAAAQIDTTAKSDLLTAQYVYLQMGLLQFQADVITSAQASFHTAYSLAQKAESPFWQARALEGLCLIYSAVDDIPRLRKGKQIAAALYRPVGTRAEEASTYETKISQLLLEGRKDEAKRLIDAFEQSAQMLDPNVPQRYFPFHFYHRGTYHLLAHEWDSAAHYFHLLDREASNPAEREYAAKGLYQLYKTTHRVDSMAKYMERWEARIDSTEKHRRLLDLREHCSVTEQEAYIQLKAEKSRAHWILLLTVVLAAVFFIVNFYAARRKHRQQISQMQAINEAYLASRDRLAELEAQLAHLDAAPSAVPSAERDALAGEIVQLRGQISDWQGADQRADTPAVSLRLNESALVGILHQKAAKALAASRDERLQLVALFEEHAPAFVAALPNAAHLSLDEKVLCCLVKLHFLPSEISVLFDCSAQQTTNMRARLYLKMFGQKGGAKDFDRSIRSLAL